MLFSDNSPIFFNSEKSPLFIDLETQNITYCDYKLYSSTQFVVNVDLSEIWTWGKKSKQIWKISEDNITLMGILETYGNRLLTTISNGLSKKSREQIFPV